MALLKQHGGNICFNTVFQYSEHKISKSELITTFLAMLELIKIKRITVYQTSIFSPIYLKSMMNRSSDNDIIVDNTESN